MKRFIFCELFIKEKQTDIGGVGCKSNMLKFIFIGNVISLIVFLIDLCANGASL